jgi:two-component system, chemotaxis family, protein-glutamate methylesterase/glutaminase
MSVALSAASAAPAAGHAPIRVMVVDDAVVVRGLVSRWIEEEPGLVLAASVRTGRDAVSQMERAHPDVVVLDVEMPELDGISALPLLLEKNRDLVVIMASTLTRRNAEVSLRALSLGAADYIPKPETNHGITTSATFRRELIDKIRQLGGQRRRRDGLTRPPLSASPGARPALRAVEPAVAAPPSIKLRPFTALVPRVLVIGSSTGGPQALAQVVTRLGPIVERIPVLITSTCRRPSRRSWPSTLRAPAAGPPTSPPMANRSILAPCIWRPAANICGLPGATPYR